MSDRKVISIGEGALRRAVARRIVFAPAIMELNRAHVGTRTLVAERAHARGSNVWRIRIEGTDSCIEWNEAATMRATFAALVGTEPAVLEEWLAARAHPV
jgi:hypothetical protein